MFELIVLLRIDDDDDDVCIWLVPIWFIGGVVLSNPSWSILSALKTRLFDLKLDSSSLRLLIKSSNSFKDFSIFRDAGDMIVLLRPDPGVPYNVLSLSIPSITRSLTRVLTRKQANILSKSAECLPDSSRVFEEVFTFHTYSLQWLQSQASVMRSTRQQTKIIVICAWFLQWV